MFSKLTSSLKYVGVNNVVPPVVLLHSINALSSVSVDIPNINLIASWSVLKSIDMFVLVALLYLSMLVLASVKSILPPILTIFAELSPSTVKTRNGQII